MDQQDVLSLLLIGGTNVGKTHYGGQLLKRLNYGHGSLIMDGVAENLTPFEEVITKLSQGCSAGHTESGTYRESVWPVRSRHGKSTQANLIWPDYAGEQVGRFTETRSITSAWRGRLRQSTGWLLFVRIEQARSFEDIFTRPRNQEGMTRQSLPVLEIEKDVDVPLQTEAGESSTEHWSGQAEFVELLQLLLFVKEVGTAQPLRCPALIVVLSCWDELHLGDELIRPDKLLQERLPLLSSFVTANWDPAFLSIVGLSALGKPLDPMMPDDDYMDKGPETQGWVVMPDGSKNSDLTIPVSNLMAMVAQHEGL